MSNCLLIIDDNAVIRRMLRTVFEQQGWIVCGEAENGQEAIAKAGNLSPDLIVLDLAMPIMNGLEAAPALRRMLPAVPIILFTLHHNKVLEKEAWSAGVTAVVSKEESVSALIHRAQNLVRKAS
jgi:CheY-like chemotaxis protein